MSFAHARAGLLKIARRVLVKPADADDVVQDAWVRWQETDRDRVRDPSAFLTTTTTRLALNLGQSARARHEVSVGWWAADTIDPSASTDRRCGSASCRSRSSHGAQVAFSSVVGLLSGGAQRTAATILMPRSSRPSPACRLSACVANPARCSAA